MVKRQLTGHVLWRGRSVALVWRRMEPVFCLHLDKNVSVLFTHGILPRKQQLFLQLSRLLAFWSATCVLLRGCGCRTRQPICIRLDYANEQLVVDGI